MGAGERCQGGLPCLIRPLGRQRGRTSLTPTRLPFHKNNAVLHLRSGRRDQLQLGHHPSQAPHGRAIRRMVPRHPHRACQSGAQDRPLQHQPPRCRPARGRTWRVLSHRPGILEQLGRHGRMLEPHDRVRAARRRARQYGARSRHLARHCADRAYSVRRRRSRRTSAPFSAVIAAGRTAPSPGSSPSAWPTTAPASRIGTANASPIWAGIRCCASTSSARPSARRSSSAWSAGCRTPTC